MSYRIPGQKNEQEFLLSIDNVIFGFDAEQEQIKVLLFKRPVDPLKGSWSLIGSFIDREESAEEAAERILYTFTGIDNVYLEQFHTYSDPNRDPGGRVITVAYYSIIRIKEHDENLLETYNASWFSLTEVPDLVLDHQKILSDALQQVQRQASSRPIGFYLLPEKFTLPKLLALYQQIFQNEIDDRNFRKKILSTQLLKRLDEKDKSSSKKGAYFYHFDEEVYFNLVKKGYSFNFI